MSSFQELYDAFCENPELLGQMALEDLKIDRDAPLQPYLYEQAQNYFKWASLASLAQAKANAQRFKVKEELWPEARQEARGSLEGNSAKVTEGRIDDLAMLDEDYRAGQTSLVELEHVAETLRAAERAMAQRLEMLRSLNSRQRGEFGGIPTDDVVQEATEAFQGRKAKVSKSAKH
jgi:hypothetical protein